MAKKNDRLVGEILPSEKLGMYQYFGRQITRSLASNPSRLWDVIQFNPWIAMAVYADMEEKDAAVFSALDTRKNNVLAKTRNVLPVSDKLRDKKIAAFVAETLDQYFLNFDAFLYESLDAIGKGVVIAEKIWDDASDRLYIKECRFKPQHLFSFGAGTFGAMSPSLVFPQTGPLQLRVGANVVDMPLGGALDEERFFVFSFRPRHGNRWGDPVDRKAYWPSCFKRASIKQWLKYQEKGSGTVLTSYGSGAAEGEQQKALDIAEAIVTETAVAKPERVTAEVLQMVRSIGSSHKELVDDFCNKEIFRVFLGQTLTSSGSDGGHGSMALGQVHERKEETITEADSKALMQAVNEQIVKPIVRENFGPNVPCPIWTIEYAPRPDTQAKAKLFATGLKDIGIPLSRQQIYDDLQLEEPMDEADTLAPPPLTPSTNDPLDDSVVTEYSEEKKTLNTSRSSSLRTQRFKRHRPSTIEFLDEP